MHNNLKFVPRDEDIQVWWGQLVFRFILGVGVCAFPHVLGMEKSKQIVAHPLRIISGTALSVFSLTHIFMKRFTATGRS